MTAPLFAVFSLAASAATRPVTSACGIASAVFRLAARSDTRSVTCDWAMPPASWGAEIFGVSVLALIVAMTVPA